jgi:tetratricopeptide (TPR) repeat protein
VYIRAVFFAAVLTFFPAGFSFSSDTMSREEQANIISAREDLVAGEYYSAEQKCRTVLEDNPGSFQANLLLGAVLGKIPGREEEALSYYQSALEIDGNFPGIYGEMSSLYNRLGMDEETIRILTVGVEMFPEESSLNYALGLAYFMNKKDPVKAVSFFNVALKKQPEDHKLLYITGLSEIMAGNIAMALEYITRLREAKNETLATKLEDIIRERYAGSKMDVPGAVDSYLPEKGPEGQAVPAGRVNLQPGAGPEKEGETTVEVTPGTRTVKGSGTISVKQTYEYDAD